MVPTVTISLANNNNNILAVVTCYLLVFRHISVLLVVFQFRKNTLHESAILMELLIHIYSRNSNLHVCTNLFYQSFPHPVALSKPTAVLFCCLWVKQVPRETFFQRSLISFLSTDFSALPRNMTCKHLFYTFHFFYIPCSLSY